jgi:hypothetical protein
VSVESGALRVVAAPGEANRIAVGGFNGVRLTVADVLSLAPGAGCSATGAVTADCEVAGVVRVEVDAGDGDDVVWVDAPLPARLLGGDGNDVVRIAGEDPVAASLDGGAGDDQLLAGSGDDSLAGGDGDDFLWGGPGADTIDGAVGADAADAGPGADDIVLEDELEDTAFCGSGRDQVRAEALDELDLSCELVAYGPPGRIGRLRAISGGGRFVRVPGQPLSRVDRRILPDVLYLIARYHLQLGDGFAFFGHAFLGEHPLGLAVDIYPGPGGSWNSVDRLAHWAEPRQNHPRPPFRWVGYNGDYNHGRGNHLHLSWAHSPGRPGRPVRKVWTFDVHRPGPVLPTARLAPLGSRTPDSR